MVPLDNDNAFAEAPMTILSVPVIKAPFVPITILLDCNVLAPMDRAVSAVPSVMVPDATLNVLAAAPICILFVPVTVAPFVAIKTFVSWIPAVPMDMDAPDNEGMLNPILTPAAEPPKLQDPEDAPNEHAKLFEHTVVLYVCGAGNTAGSV